MRRGHAAAASVGALALAITAGAAGAPRRGAGTLELNGTFAIKITRTACPPSAPDTTDCYDNSGTGVVPGLGSTSIRFTLLQARDPANEACKYWSAPSVALTVAGRGGFELTASNPTCQLPGSTGSMAFTVTGATGIYGGASGSGTILESGSVETGAGHVVWTGRLTVPRVDFDLTPPVLGGAGSKTIRLARKTRRVRVRYTVTAADAVDGPVAVACKPPSGSLFRSGRTRVTCTAVDSSGNTATTSFVVTVKRR